MLRHVLVLLLTLQIALAPMVQAAQGAVDNVSIAGNIAESGFENNYLTHREQQILVNLLACEHGEVCENEETITKEDLMARDAERDQVLANCEGDYSATCTNARRDLYIALAEYADAQEKNPSLREDATFTWFMSRTALMYAQYADINDFDTEDGTPLISPEDYDSDIALGILNYDIYLALGLATPGTQIAAAETDAGMPLGLLAGMLRLFRGGVIGAYRGPVPNPTARQVATAEARGVDPRWVSQDGVLQYPANDGFAGTPTKGTMQPGTRFDRYGGFTENGQFRDTGDFVADAGVPFNQRSLPANDINRPYTQYEVLRPIPDAQSGPAAPWFGQPGGGIQHKLPMSIESLISGGFIRAVN